MFTFLGLLIYWGMSAFTIWLMARVLQSMIGVRFSWIRLVVAGIVFLLVNNPITTALWGRRETPMEAFPLAWIGILGMFISLLVAMLLLLVWEMVVPSNTVPGPRYVYRSIRQFLSRSRRYFQIFRITMKHGLGAYLLGGRRRELRTSEGRAAVARSLRMALNEAGVAFVKLGQIISTRSDILPNEFLIEFEKLQNTVEPLPWNQVEPVVAQALTPKPIEQVFSAFSHEPLAAASIAQVHTATLVTGADVVVKVRRPGIDEQIAVDLDIMSRMARSLQRATSWGRSMGVVDLVNGFSQSLNEELDLRVEARNMQAVAANPSPQADSGTHIPRVWPEFSSRTLLVMERIRGVPMNQAAPVIFDQRLNAEALATDLFSSLLYQMTVGGTFHADPHPGNVMLMEDGRLTLLDFGSVGRIDANMRMVLVQFLMELNAQNTAGVTDAIIDMVGRPRNLDIVQFERAIGRFMATWLTPGMQPEMTMVAELFKLLARFEMQIPREVAAIFRALGTVEGTLRSIAPQINIIDEARTYATDMLKDRFTPQATFKTFSEEMVSLIPMMRRMPRRIDRIASALEEGRLTVNIAEPQEKVSPAETMGAAVVTICSTLLAAAAGVMGALLFGRPDTRMVGHILTVNDFLGLCFVVAALILSMRALIVIFRPRPT